MQPGIWEARAGIVGGGARPIVGLPMAGKCARTAKYAGASGDPGGWLEHSAGGVAAACLETGYRAAADGNACGEFQLGRNVGGSHGAGCEPCRKSPAGKYHVRVQME